MLSTSKPEFKDLNFVKCFSLLLKEQIVMSLLDEVKNLTTIVIAGLIGTGVTLYFLIKDKKVFSPILQKMEAGLPITSKEQSEAAAAVRKSKSVAKYKDDMDEDTLANYDEVEERILDYENVVG